MVDYHSCSVRKVDETEVNMRRYDCHEMENKNNKDSA